jgi:hypothetical protein
MSNYAKLRAIDVSKQVKQKGKFNYISWAYAVDQLLQLDPKANWEYKFFKNADGLDVPYCMIGETAMVFCTVTAFDKQMTAQLPVLSMNNQPVPKPNSAQINNAMQRALTKAIALHGLSLYLYQGEDIPTDEIEIEPPVLDNSLLETAINIIKSAPDEPTLKDAYFEYIKVFEKFPSALKSLKDATNARKKEIKQ